MLLLPPDLRMGSGHQYHALNLPDTLVQLRSSTDWVLLFHAHRGRPAR